MVLINNLLQPPLIPTVLHDLTSSVAWNTSSSANVSISNAAGSAGLATANQVSNNTDISATYLTKTSATTTVNVSAAVLQSIAITPTSKTIAKGLTQAYTATGTLFRWVYS